MEHFVYQLIRGLIWSLDDLTQKSLGQVIPDLEKLRQDPAEALGHRTINIGPRRPYASSIGLTLLATLLCACLMNLVIDVLGFGLPPPIEVAVTAWIILVVLLGVMSWVLIRGRRGGVCVLGAEGVEFRYRETRVSCPWALFGEPGHVNVVDREDFLLPISPGAIRFVSARRHDSPLALGHEVKTPQFEFVEAAQAKLRAHYEVSAEQLGPLLLHLGRLLASSQPKQIPAGEEAPVQLAVPALRDVRGWITVSLSRLQFPPLCCACGEPTKNTRPFCTRATLAKSGLLHLEGGEIIQIQVPVCDDCEKGRRTKLTKLITFSAAIGALSAAFIVSVAQKDAEEALLVIVGIAGAAIGGVMGKAVSEFQSEPVEFQNYVPRQGKLDIRFRRPEYGAQLLAKMGLLDRWNEAPS